MFDCTVELGYNDHGYNEYTVYSEHIELIGLV